MPEVCVSLAIGDVVNFTEQSTTDRKFTPSGDFFVVSDASLDGGCLQYAVNGCSWYDPEHLELVSRATPETLQFVTDMLQSEEDENDEEIEIEDDDDDEDDC
jgi:hypothetical protein